MPNDMAAFLSYEAQRERAEARRKQAQGGTYLASLLNDTDTSDLTIKNEHYSRQVHKAIVCSRSRGIARACEGQPKDEWPYPPIWLNEDGSLSTEKSKEAIDAVLQYIYTFGYDDKSEDPFSFQCEVMELASDLELQDPSDIAHGKAIRLLDGLFNPKDFVMAMAFLARWTGSAIEQKCQRLAEKNQSVLARWLLDNHDAVDEVGYSIIPYELWNPFMCMKEPSVDLCAAMLAELRAHRCSDCDKKFNLDTEYVGKVHCPYCGKSLG